MKTKLIFTALILLISFGLKAQTAVLTLNSLFCNKTTEAGEDEVYFLTNYHYNFQNGASGQFQTGPYNMNDGRQPRQIGSFNVFQGQLLPGMSVDITVFIMEQDGGGSANIISQAQSAMNTAVPLVCGGYPPACPYAQAIGGVVNFAASLPEKLRGLINDTDDFLGSISVRISNNNGYISVQFYGGERCVNYGPAPNVPNPSYTAVGNLIGDGSSYNFGFTAGAF